MTKINDKIYNKVAKKLAKKFNVRVDAEKTALYEALEASDFILEYKGDEYKVYASRLIAIMYDNSKSGKSFKV